jgi:hypothetical protein
LEEWSSRLEAIHHRRVDLAVRRLLSAVSYRTDPADRLIDAAVALENLFGTRQGEVTFRIAAATARLLGSDFDERVSTQREVTRLYRIRSDIIHGEEVDPQDTSSAAEALIRLVFQALRRLYRHHPELVRDEDRSRRLILE